MQNLIVEEDSKPRRYGWQKGVSGNPGGRPKISPELRVKFAKFRERTLQTLIRFGGYSVSQINEIASNDQSNAMEAVVARTYAKAIEGSDRHTRELLDRVLGPIINTILVDDSHGDVSRSLNPDIIYNALLKLRTEPKEEKCSLIAKPLEQLREQSQESSQEPSALE